MLTAHRHVAGETGGGAFALPEPPQATQGAPARRVPPQALHVGINPAPPHRAHIAVPEPEHVAHCTDPRPPQFLQYVCSLVSSPPFPRQTGQVTDLV